MTIGKKKLGLLVLIIIVCCLFVYKYSPYKIEFIGNYDKIWAHRVNSKEKLSSAIKYFKGVELDLVYKNDFLDVNHPPTNSINLNFKDYLGSLPKGKFPFLWLDIKNLTYENSEEILSIIQNTLKDRKYPFKRVLIETRYPEALQKFTELGFKTSYYLPYGLRQKQNLENEIKKIQNVLKKQPNIAISSDYRDYYIMKKYFPNKPKYLWMINSITKRWFSETRTILKDSTVKIVLVKYNTLSGNR